MNQRYFIIEPKYADPDTFCCFTVGSDRARASIQIYADLGGLREVARLLVTPSLEEEAPTFFWHNESDDIFEFHLSVLPNHGEYRRLRFRIFQDWLDDGAPFRADIRFKLTPEEAEDFSNELKAWCAKPESAFIWTGD